MSQQWKVYKQRYCRNLKNLSLFRPVLLSGKIPSEHVAAVEIFQTKSYYRNVNNLSLCRPVLLSGNFQSEHVAGGVSIQTTILSEL